MVCSKSGSCFVYFPGDKTLTVIRVIIEHIEQSVCKLIAAHTQRVLGWKGEKMNFYLFLFLWKENIQHLESAVTQGSIMTSRFFNSRCLGYERWILFQSGDMGKCKPLGVISGKPRVHLNKNGQYVEDAIPTLASWPWLIFLSSW